MQRAMYKASRRLVLLVLGVAAFMSGLSMWVSKRDPGSLKAISRYMTPSNETGERAHAVDVRESHPFGKSGPAAGMERYLESGDELNPIPNSRYINGVAGYSLFQNLYLRNGTFYFVTDDMADSEPHLPPLKIILSAPPTETGARVAPTDQDFQTISREEAAEVLGKFVVRLEGTSVLLNDQRHPNSSSFMGHYFHFVVETFLGAWRLLAADFALDKGHGTTQGMETPRRIMFRTAPDDWRDRAGLTPWFINNVMPGSSVEDMFVWQDRAKSEAAFVFEQLTISDRFAAHRFNGLNALWNKMSAEVINMEAPLDWMDPLRQNIRKVGAIHGCQLNRQTDGVPIVTYVNRQKTGRRLNDTDAEGLVEKMQALHDEGIIEFYDAKMEDLPRVEQFCLASKTDILMGVHGNGLSHQLWMQPGSWVIEIMDVGGFAMDYALPAELMSHNYRAIHNDTTFEKDQWITPEGKGVKQSKLFHGKNIRLDPTFMHKFIKEIAQGDAWQS